MKSTQKFENFSNEQVFFQKLIIVEILMPKDENFRKATCNNIENSVDKLLA